MPNPKITDISFWLVVCLLVFFAGVIINYLFVFSRLNDMEGFNSQNTKLTYTPKKTIGVLVPSLRFTVNDFMREAIEVPECLKIYKRLPKPKDDKSTSTVVRPEEEYADEPTTLEIYKKYTSNMADKETELMDTQFGNLFRKEFINAGDLNAFLDNVEKNMLAENRLHGFIKYSCVSPQKDYPFTEFSDYFGNLIYRYKDREMQLNEIKTFMYKVLWPVYLHSKFIEHYKTNQTIYSKKDDAMYVLNITRESLLKINMDELTHRETERNIYVFKEDPANIADPSITIESLTLFTMMSMLYNVYSLTLPGVCSHLTIPRAEMRKVFLDYLKIKFPKVNAESVIAFLLDINNDPEFPE